MRAERAQWSGVVRRRSSSPRRTGVSNEMAAPRTWSVHEHGPIERLNERVWTVRGAVPGMALQRRMTVVRLEDGGLLVHNAVALAEDLMAEIERWGEPAHLVVPSGLHRLDAHAWKTRYPKSRVWCPAGARSRVEQVVAVDGPYEYMPRSEVLSVEYLDGLRERASEGVFTVAGPDGQGTLIFNDALFNHPHVEGFHGAMLRWMGSSGGPRVTPLFRAVGVADKARLAAQLRHRGSARELAHLVPGHGEVVSLDAPGVLREVADRLSPV